MNALHFIRGV